MSGKVVAIVGAGGFVGRVLGEQLAAASVAHSRFDRVVTSPDIKFCDVTIPDSLNSLGQVECIINLAAEHRDDIRPVELYDKVNVEGARNVCEAATRLGVNKIIFTSSVAVYGFAAPDTDESGEALFFNDYGRTKLEAEGVYKEWQMARPDVRSLVIIRPTVIFGEGNRGNVFNLIRQVASGRFLMVGDGLNVKSMAYVENVAAFIKHCISFDTGVHIYNYVDKPDFDMNSLVSEIRNTVRSRSGVGIRVPKVIGLVLGVLGDFISFVTGKPFPVSSVRVRKFLGTTQFSSAAHKTGFIAPVDLREGLRRTLKYELMDAGKPISKSE